MSNVTLIIAGRSYPIACADGEEEHITNLGRAIDEKLHAMGQASGQSEARTLLFAALLLADENFELTNRKPGIVPATPAPGAAEDIAPLLETLAERLESCAAALEERHEAH
jgi:cell division protein ZapA